jgi:voltage-gated potassium channel Kch
VAEIRDPKNMEVARLVGRDEAQLILAGDLIARITAQTCRQSGLSVIYTELLDFGGDEIYFKDEPALAGKTFGESLLAYEDSCVIGLRFKDGKMQLNPPMDTRLQAGDKIIAISQDDDTIHLSGRSEHGIQNAAIRQPQAIQLASERILILGWNRRAPLIISELDNYVTPGSEIVVVSRNAEEAQALCRCENLKNQSVHFQSGDATQRQVLDEMQVNTYNYVIVLSDDILGPQEADAQTLVTLLHLREMSEQTGHNFAIVSEMLDVRNRELAEVTRADDFIVSDKLISLMMSQISENKELTAVFQDLFDPEGSELYLKPIKNYVETGIAVNFYTLVEAARQRGEVALGYRIRSQAENPQAFYGVKVNPIKSALITFAPEDRIIVLAE